MRYLMIVVIVGFVVVDPCPADVWTVDDDGKADFNTIQAAIDAASDGDEVQVHPGVYSGGGDEVVDMLGKAIWLHGSGAADVTVIDGEGVRRGILCNGDETAETVIEGFTLRNCAATWVDWDSDGTIDNWEVAGGGMGIGDSSPTINACTFFNNTAVNGGGGVFAFRSSPTLTDCTFTGNTATGDSSGGGMFNRSFSEATLTNCSFLFNDSETLGGGMYNDDHSSPTLTDCLFAENTAQNRGGGMYNRYFSSPTVNNTSFNNNIAVSGGGGMYNSTGSGPSLTGVDFNDNSATADAGYGGGIVNYNSSPTINACSFTGNTSAQDGGGMYCFVGSYPVIVDTSFLKNSAANRGGGIYCKYYSEPSLNQCTIDGNTAGRSGGGIYIHNNCTLTIDRSSLNTNTAVVEGGGLWTANATTLHIDDCDMASNSAALGGDVYAQRGATVRFGGNNTAEDLACTGASTTLAFAADSTCTVSGAVSPSEDGGVSLDIDNLNTTPSLVVSGTLALHGSLAISNNTGSLLNADVGLVIPLVQATTLPPSSLGSVVVPPMGEDKGLVVKEQPAARGGGTEVAVEVVDVTEVDVDDPFLAGLDGVPIDIVSFDADNDGADELAVLVDGTPGTVVVFAITEDSPPTLMEGFMSDVGNGPVDIDAADINGDGLEDILVANADDSSMTVLLTAPGVRGTPTFVASTVIVSGAGQRVSCAAAIDWDGDGDMDAVAGVDLVNETLNDGYQIMLDVIGGSPKTGPFLSIPLYDLDPDPDADDLVGDPPTAVAGAANGGAAWGFAGGTQYGAMHHGSDGRSVLDVLANLEGYRIVCIEARDLDDAGGDGNIDILAASDETQSVYLIPGEPALPDGFDDLIPIAVLEPVADVVAMDADGDGDIDLIVTAPLTESGDSLVLFRNDGPAGEGVRALKGQVWSKQVLNTGGALTRLSGGDLDGKGEGDDWVTGIAGPSGLLGNASVMEQSNILRASCPEDVNGDGIVDITDLLAVIAAFNTAGPQGDVNGDGIVDITDLLLIIGAFGVSC